MTFNERIGVLFGKTSRFVFLRFPKGDMATPKSAIGVCVCVCTCVCAHARTCMYNIRANSNVLLS